MSIVYAVVRLHVQLFADSAFYLKLTFHVCKFHE